MIIAGAGMAGLIAGNYFQRKATVTIWEMQKELPHNHSALLRFKSTVVADAVGIPFHRVMVHKALVHGEHFVDFPNPYVCNQYSLKTTDKIMERSVWDLSPGYRYIAPSNFIESLAEGLHIEYGRNFSPGDTSVPVISTIPMPIMMKKIGWNPSPYFQKKTIWALNCDLGNTDVDVYQTIYFSDLETPHYRASIMGNHLTIEFAVDPELCGDLESDVIDGIVDFFGIPSKACTYHNIEIKAQEYGKIVPIGDEERKEFMYTLTRDYNIYSLGRFATWRQILLDDLIHDLDVIQSLISAEGTRRLYTQRLKSAQQGRTGIIKT